VNVKFVWQSLTELRLWFLALLLLIAAGATQVSVLVGLGVVLLVVVSLSYLEFFRVRIGPARSYHQAVRLVRKARCQEAVELASRYTNRRQRDVQGWEARALAVFGLGRLEEALGFADHAVSLKRRWQGLMIRGLILRYLACPDAALEDFESSYRIRAHPYTKMLMGGAFASLRRMDTAVKILQRSTRSVRLSLTFLGLAGCYRLMRDNYRAVKAYEQAAGRARREVSSGAPCASILAYSLAQLSKNAEAEDAANAALKRNDRDTMALSTQALLSVRRGDLDAVESTIRRTLLISPQAAVGVLCDPQSRNY